MDQNPENTENDIPMEETPGGYSMPHRTTVYATPEAVVDTDDEPRVDTDEDGSDNVSFHMIDNKHSFHHVETEADVVEAELDDVDDDGV